MRVDSTSPWRSLDAPFPETATIVVGCHFRPRLLSHDPHEPRYDVVVDRRRRRRPRPQPWSWPGHVAGSPSSTPASRATHQPRTCTASSAPTAFRPPSCWPPAAPRSPATAGTSSPARSRAVTLSAAPSGDRPRVLLRLDDGSMLRARRVLVTTGLRDDFPDIPGVRERWGRDLLHCPYCHGYEVRDQPLGVLGGTAGGLAHAHLVRQWSDDVVLFANGTAVTADQREQLVARAIGVVDAPVARLVVEDDRLTGVELDRRSNRSPVRGVRPAPVRPQRQPADRPGLRTDDNGWVAVDATGRTSVPGIWAAGNAVNPRAQVITAAGEGSAAAIAINNDLVEEDLPIAVTNFRLGFPLAPV